jgi:hypothetical protein
VTQRDGALWGDDAVELFVQPDRGKPGYFQFIGNSAGAIFDARGSADPGWNGDWTYRASTGADSWTGEVSIPLSSLGIAAGPSETAIGLNICRDQSRPTATASCWAPINGSFHNPDLFGALTLARESQSTRQEDVAPGKDDLTVGLQVDWKALGIDPQRAKISAPEIAAFQPAMQYESGQRIRLHSGGGALLVVEQ